MVGKRERKRGPRIPGVLTVLATVVILLTSGGPRGAAVSSPAEDAVRKAPETAEAISMQKRTMERSLEEPVPLEEEPPRLSGLLPVSGSVEDTYFDDVVFLGDSRTEGFYLYSGLKHGNFLYAVGSTVESIFTKAAWQTEDGRKLPLLDALAETDCGKIYLMLGVNELGWTKVENFHDQYAKVIDRIREDHPDAEIILQSILPVSALQEEKQTYVNNERIGVYNEVIAALAEEKDCWFANVAEAVVDKDGCLIADWNFDGIHLNPTGCRAWLHYLRTHSVDGVHA